QVTTDFGALSGPAGWRLLNVAVTRARCRAEIVSSIRAGDIPESVACDGAQYLRRYLGYAAQAFPAATTESATEASGDGQREFGIGILTVTTLSKRYIRDENDHNPR